MSVRPGLRLVELDAKERMPRTGRRDVELLLEKREELISAYQQIVSLRDGACLGVEALLRLPPGTAFAGTQEAFDTASGTDLLVDLELAAIEAHVSSAGLLRDGFLFLNLSARSLLDDRLEPRSLSELLSQRGTRAEQVVIELTELVRIAEPERFARHLEPFRNAGFSLALDDFGSGFADVRLLLELAPDYVKIDRSLVQGSAQSHRKRLFLESMETLGRRIGFSLIAEGVETSEDLEACRACGVPFAQGWAVGTPGPAEAVVGLRQVLHKRPALDEESVGCLSVPLEPVDLSRSVGSLLGAFESERDLHALAVVASKRPVGLVTRNFLLLHLASPYGFSLWRDRPVSRLLEEHGAGFDILPASATLEEAASVVQARPQGRRFHPLLVVNARGEFHGLLPVDLLLSEMTRLKIEYAFQSNPLTKLPGSRLLEVTADRHLRAGTPFTLGWADLDDFKSLNDHYGFSRGDGVLLLVAEVLQRHVSEAGGLLVHPGGDDFAFLVPTASDEALGWAATEEFSRRVPELYDDAERHQGGIEALDRRGVRRFHPFTALSIGLVRWEGGAPTTYPHMVELVAEMKAVAKQKEGPSVVVNRRRTGGPLSPSAAEG